MNIPTNLKYTKDHEWIRLEGDNAYIGITDYAQHELGDIVFVDVDTLDETLEAEETFGTIEAVKTSSEMFMPVGGKVIEFNETLRKKSTKTHTAKAGSSKLKSPMQLKWTHCSTQKLTKPSSVNHWNV